MPDALIYRVGPQPGWPIYVPDAWNNREGPQAREPSKCLNEWSYRERLAKEIFWSPATRGLRKDSDSTVTPVAEAIHVLADLASPRSPETKQLYHFHAQLSLGQSCHRQKSLKSMGAGLLRLCLSLCDPVDCGQSGFSVREGFLQARILEHIGQYWLPYLSRALYFLLP